MNILKDLRAIELRTVREMQENNVAKERGKTEDADERARIQRQGDKMETTGFAADGNNQTEAIRFRQCS